MIPFPGPSRPTCGFRLPNMCLGGLVYAPDMVPLFHNATNPSPLNGPMQCATHIVCPCKWHNTFWGGGSKGEDVVPACEFVPSSGQRVRARHAPWAINWHAPQPQIERWLRLLSSQPQTADNAPPDLPQVHPPQPPTTTNAFPVEAQFQPLQPPTTLNALPPNPLPRSNTDDLTETLFFEHGPYTGYLIGMSF